VKGYAHYAVVTSLAETTAADEIQTVTAVRELMEKQQLRRWEGGGGGLCCGISAATRAGKASGKLADTRVGVAILLGDPYVRRHSLQHG
jgi:hypothetical protein